MLYFQLDGKVFSLFHLLKISSIHVTEIPEENTIENIQLSVSTTNSCINIYINVTLERHTDAAEKKELVLFSIFNSIFISSNQ